MILKILGFNQPRCINLVTTLHAGNSIYIGLVGFQSAERTNSSLLVTNVAFTRWYCVAQFYSTLFLAQRFAETFVFVLTNLNICQSGASLQMQGKFHEAIKCYCAVLASSKQEEKVRSKRKQKGENSGDAEAYRAIAECYTELGEVDLAKVFYKKYSNSL